MADIIVEGGLLVTMDRKRRVIKDGAVVIEGNKIIDVGKKDILKRRHQAEEVIKADKKLVMPGLVDCHVHLNQMLSRGIADDVDGRTWLHERILPYEAALSEQDVYISSLLCCMEMIRTGTTSFSDPGGYHVESMVKAVEEIGARGIVSLATMDVQDEEWLNPPSLMMSPDEAVKASENLIKKFHGKADRRIRVWTSLRADAHVSPQLVQGITNLAERYGVGVQMHTATYRERIERLRRRTGYGIIEYLDSLNAFVPNWVMAHLVWISDKEVEIMADRKVNACHIPGASLFCALGASSNGKFPELIRSGVNVCLGCDASSANNSLDMFRAMYEAATIHREARRDISLIPPQEVLEMATLDGAKALLCEDEVGTLEPGKKADLILVDINKPNWLPIHDFSIISNIVYAGDGSDVSTVIIDGKTVYKDRRFETVDESWLLAEAQKTGERVLEKMGLRLPLRYPVE